jgi:RimJ/RimL family protein N-acetyltransferase
MQRVSPDRYPRLAGLFDPLGHHLAVRAVLAGAAPGRVHVDDARQPRSAMIHVQHRFYLAGDASDERFNAALHRQFVEEIYPRALAAGDEAFTLYFSDGWHDAITGQVLAGLDPIPGERVYYELTQRPEGVQPQVPPELRLVPVDRALTQDRSISNLDDLLEEMRSERETVEAFLDQGFGVCLRGSDLLVTWCLSEYDLGERCEVGIATHPDHRRRGLATATGRAFVERAVAGGVTRIGWHCWADNQGSRSTALRIGCDEVRTYPSFLAFFDPPLNMAVHGDISLDQGALHEARGWFARAEATGRAPAWAYFAGARAAARLHDAPEAMRLLEQAAARGFDQRRYYEASEDLAGLHGTPGWDALMDRLP